MRVRHSLVVLRWKPSLYFLSISLQSRPVSFRTLYVCLALGISEYHLGMVEICDTYLWGA